MEKSIKEILKSQPQQEMSLREVLDSFSHIELTDDEYCEAMIEAKRKKEAILKQREREAKAAQNRKQLTESGWSYDQTRAYMLYRAQSLFDGRFVLDEFNEPVFDLLCHYFSGSKEFISLAAGIGVVNPRLEKGIILAGNYGTGKTWLMSLFRKNNRQVYHVEQAKDIAFAYQKNGDEAIERHRNKIVNPFNDPTVFYQKNSGLCMEDIGAEDVKNNFGNKTNVIGDILEARYVNDLLGVWFHGTTNMTTAQFGDFYGGRVTSRLREKTNFIELRGPDRRK
jgi:predicted ATPase